MVPFLSTVLVLVLTLATVAGAYTFETVDVPFPDTSNTVITGLNATDDLVGAYVTAWGESHGFVWSREGCVVPLLDMTPRGITANGLVVGFFQPPGTGGTVGFLYQDGTRQTLRVPRAGPGLPLPLATEALGVNDAGVAVGTVRLPGTEGTHGWRFDPGTQRFTLLQAPGAQTTHVTAIDNQDRIVGTLRAQDGTLHAFRWEHGVFTSVAIPGLDRVEIQVVGHTDSGIFAGNANDKGFLFDGTAIEVVAVPGARVTQLFGIRQDGAVFGRFIDAQDVSHGFVARPEAPEREPRQPKKPREPKERK